MVVGCNCYKRHQTITSYSDESLSTYTSGSFTQIQCAQHDPPTKVCSDDFDKNQLSETAIRPSPRRSVGHLRAVIRDLVHLRARRVEEKFHEIDVYNSGRINVEQFYQLLQW